MFLGYEDFVDIFGGSSQNKILFKGHFSAFLGLLLKSRYRMGVFWGVAKISNILGGFLKFLFFFLFFFFGGGGGGGGGGRG